MPAVEQSTGGDIRVQVRTEDVPHLADGHAQPVMEPTAQGHHVMPQGGVGHGVGYHRFDVLLTVRAVIAMDRMFGHHRRDLLGDIFDEALTLPLAALQLAAAAGTDLQAMLDAGVDGRRRFPPRTLVARFGSRLFPAPLGRRLLIHRHHARGRGRRGGCCGRRGLLQHGYVAGHGQGEQRHRLGPQGVQRLGLWSRQLATLGRIEDGVQERRMLWGSAYR